MKYKKILLCLLTLCMMLVLCSCSSSNEEIISVTTTERVTEKVTEKPTIATTAPPKLLTWSESKLAKKLPKPNSKYGSIITDNDETFVADIEQFSYDEFLKYEKACIEKGFTVEAKKEEKSYSARDKDGDSLLISAGNNNSMSIILEVAKYKVDIEISCEENLIFSKYDIEAYLDDSWLGRIDHGKSESYSETLKKGKHTLLFKSNEDSEVTGEVEFNINSDKKLQYELHCTMLGISVTDLNEQPTTQKETIAAKTDAQESLNEDSPEYYSTNNSSTVKNGNSGVYSYRSRGGSYYVYYIIDFDKRYVYFFTEGNGDESCMRTKIESGDLNDVLIITYHDVDTPWSEGLHFKYKNQPSHLIMQDHNGFEYDYYPTNLKEALALRDKKTFLDY